MTNVITLKVFVWLAVCATSRRGLLRRDEIDKVNYVNCFSFFLIKINVNPLMSKYFSTSNGLKQGGVLSPILFGIYIDELLSLLRNSGYGCKVGHLYCGAIGYADDVIASLHALKMMCDISLAFADEFDIKFNPMKCQLLYYGKCQNVYFDFDGVVICESDKAISYRA